MRDSDEGLTPDGLERWSRAFCLDGETSLQESAVSELAAYFGRSREEMRDRLLRGTSGFVDEWRAAGVDARDQPAATEFYRQARAELFELMEVHALRPRYSGRRYVRALAAARALRPRARRYLDFGSGVGTGALLFHQAGFDVTLADVATRLLDFCRWRFERRGLRAAFIDLVAEELPPASFDVATCFDVLEHVGEPKELVKRIHRALRPEGVLILRVSPVHDHDHPMHVVHDALMPYDLEGLGFRYDLRAMPPGFQLLIRDSGAGRPRLWSRPLAHGCRLTARQALHEGEYLKARQYLGRSLRYFPVSPTSLALACGLCLPRGVIGRLHQRWRTLKSEMADGRS